MKLLIDFQEIEYKYGYTNLLRPFWCAKHFYNPMAIIVNELYPNFYKPGQHMRTRFSTLTPGHHIHSQIRDDWNK